MQFRLQRLRKELIKVPGGYWTVSVTTAEVVIWWVEGGGCVLLVPPPPQPIPADATSRTRPRQAVNQILPAVHFLLARTSGSMRMGKKMKAEAAPATVSVKTIVTW